MVRACVLVAVKHYQRKGQPRKIEQLAENIAYIVKADKERRERQKETLFGCQAGMTEFTVTWDGRLIGCQLMQAKGTAPLERSLANAWDEYPASIVQPPRAAACVSCSWREHCCTCAATWLSETSSGQPIPEYNCHITELIQQDMVKKQKGENKNERVQGSGNQIPSNGVV